MGAGTGPAEPGSRRAGDAGTHQADDAGSRQADDAGSRHAGAGGTHQQDDAGTHQAGDILAVGTRETGSSRIHLADAPLPGEPTMRWLSHATSIEAIEQELARIWATAEQTEHEDHEWRHMAARTSVMNLVVVAGRPETGEQSADTISHLTGRHPSRTLIVLTADPDGPPWLDARIQAHCVLARPDAPEVCSELIFMTTGGETGSHLAELVTPLLIHDLPVTVWWPGEPPLGGEPARELMAVADRLVVDGSGWSGDGLRRLREVAALVDGETGLAVRDFALVRQSRWREAIAAAFDVREFLPYLGAIRRISVTYATHHETGAPGTTNVVKPLYHVAWLASRLGMRVVAPLAPVEPRGKAAAPRLRPGERPPLHRGLAAKLRSAAGDVAVVIRPIASTAPAGTTLRVEILAERRGSELRADVTAEAENVHVHTWLDGVAAMDRTFKSPRRTDRDLLADALETSGRDRMELDAIRMAAELAGPGATIAPEAPGPPGPPRPLGPPGPPTLPGPARQTAGAAEEER